MPKVVGRQEKSVREPGKGAHVSHLIPQAQIQGGHLGSSTFKPEKKENISLLSAVVQKKYLPSYAVPIVDSHVPSTHFKRRCQGEVEREEKTRRLRTLLVSALPVGFWKDFYYRSTNDVGLAGLPHCATFPGVRPSSLMFCCSYGPGCSQLFGWVGTWVYLGAFLG